MHTKTPAVRPKRLSREERRKQTDLEMRQAALREFALHGVEGTSAERIAEAAGYTRGAFYANYPNKHALLLDLIREKLTEELGSWLELADSVQDLEALFRMLDERSLRFDPDRVWAMVAEATALHAQRSPEFAHSYREYHGRIIAGFGTMLGTLFRRAGKTPPLALDEVAEAMLTLYRSTRMPAPEPGARAQGFSSNLLVLIIRGLIAVAPPALPEN